MTGVLTYLIYSLQWVWWLSCMCTCLASQLVLYFAAFVSNLSVSIIPHACGVWLLPHACFVDVLCDVLCACLPRSFPRMWPNKSLGPVPSPCNPPTIGGVVCVCAFIASGLLVLSRSRAPMSRRDRHNHVWLRQTMCRMFALFACPCL